MAMIKLLRYMPMDLKVYLRTWIISVAMAHPEFANCTFQEEYEHLPTSSGKARTADLCVSVGM